MRYVGVDVEGRSPAFQREMDEYYARCRGDSRLSIWWRRLRERILTAFGC